MLEALQSPEPLVDWIQEFQYLPQKGQNLNIIHSFSCSSKIKHRAPFGVSVITYI
jgi:hypothetical protein